MSILYVRTLTLTITSRSLHTFEKQERDALISSVPLATNKRNHHLSQFDLRRRHGQSSPGTTPCLPCEFDPFDLF